MTPEEKAKELIEKFTHEISGECENGCNSVSHHNAKQCALIAVGELINDSMESHELAKEMHPHVIGLMGGIITFWQEVKQSIEKQ